MGKLILMTVGTSVFDASKSFNNSDINGLKTAVEAGSSKANIENDISNAMSDAQLTGRYNLTAEMASLVAFNEKRQIVDCDWVILLHSEDKESEVCAHVNAQAIVKKFFNMNVTFPITPSDDQHIAGLKDYITTDNNGGVGIIKINGLSPESNETQFLDALSNLEETINDIRQNFPQRVAYFNVTGGLKGVIPLTTVLSIQKNMHIFYMHEESEGVFKIDYQELKSIITSGTGKTSRAHGPL